MLIENALLVDGSGAEPFAGSLRIRGQQIEALGALEPRPGETVIDAEGKVLAPGFIDTHSHVDDGLLAEPEAMAVISQGITTVVVGQDGSSIVPIDDFFTALETTPITINVASYAGHGTLRGMVMGANFQRPATEEELEQMGALLRHELDSGALGLSTGLEYDPGIYASSEEIMHLARLTAAAGGRYISHLRSEDRDLWAAVEEILTIGEETGVPVQISHLKLAMRRDWGQATRLLARFDEARARGIDITADLYPYTYWQSSMTVLFPERDFDNPRAAELVLDEIVAPEGLLIPQFEPQPELAGHTLAEIAAAQGRAPVEVLLELAQKADALPDDDDRVLESVIATSMDDADVARLMRWPHTNFCTDGELRDTHPRGFGSFPRILGRYVRERGVLTLAEAIHRMSGLAATHMNFSDRGLLKPGYMADLVLFDRETILDHATLEDPQAPSSGILAVWVAGQKVYEEGRPTRRRPGRILRRNTAPRGR